MPTISDQANKAALESVKAEKPSQFTIGGRFDGKTLVGGITYDRTWKNGWGATAYARAWWDDLPVRTDRPQVEAGGEITKRF